MVAEVWDTEAGFGEVEEPFANAEDSKHTAEALEIVEARIVKYKAARCSE